MRSMAAFEIRRLHRKIAQLDRRVGLVDIAGKVKPGSQDMDKRTVVLVLGQSSTGQDILSPPIRWQGTAAGDYMMHAVPADNEQMVMHSPSGTIGSGTMAHWGTYDKDHTPPSKEKNQAVLQRGKGKIVWNDDSLVIQFGDNSGFAISEKELKMLGTFRGKDGSRAAVFLGSMDSAGNANVEGNASVLV